MTARLSSKPSLGLDFFSGTATDDGTDGWDETLDDETMTDEESQVTPRIALSPPPALLQRPESNVSLLALLAGGAVGDGEAMTPRSAYKARKTVRKTAPVKQLQDGKAAAALVRRNSWIGNLDQTVGLSNRANKSPRGGGGGGGTTADIESGGEGRSLKWSPILVGGNRAFSSPSKVRRHAVGALPRLHPTVQKRRGWVILLAGLALFFATGFVLELFRPHSVTSMHSVSATVVVPPAAGARAVAAAAPAAAAAAEEAAAAAAALSPAVDIAAPFDDVGGDVVSGVGRAPRGNVLVPSFQDFLQDELGKEQNPGNGVGGLYENALSDDDDSGRNSEKGGVRGDQDDED